MIQRLLVQLTDDDAIKRGLYIQMFRAPVDFKKQRNGIRIAVNETVNTCREKNVLKGA